MHLNSDISNALQHIEAIKMAIDESHDPKLQMHTSDSINLILNILQDPVLRSLVQIQDSMTDLNAQISQHPSVLPNDFDINATGELVLNVPSSLDMYDADYHDEQRVPSAQLSPRSPNSISIGDFSSHNTLLTSTDDLLLLEEQQQQQQQMNAMKKVVRGGSAAGAYSDLGRVEEDRPQSAVSDSSKHFIDIMASEWAQIQSLELVNDGTGLGFGIIGARTSGVIVKTILANGVADRDGRLISGDHILQIGDVNLHDMVSEQVASVLRQSGTHVRLVVARPIDPANAEQQDSDGTAIVPARLLSDPNELERYLIAAGYGDIFGTISTPSTPTPTVDDRFAFFDNSAATATGRSPQSSSSAVANTMLDLPETERFLVELTKDANGLGITIAGYVCEKEELSGIFVKSVSAGSAADISGRIQVNDRIIEVDGQSLQGFSNHQAVEVLKKSGTVVSLCLERYLRGPKYEQLQQAIAANETKAPPSAMDGVTSRPHSGMSMASMRSATVATSQQAANRKTGATIDGPPSFTMFPQSDHDERSMGGGHDKSPPAPPKSAPPIAVVSGNRKLALARDSIETKSNKSKHADDTLASDDDAALTGTTTPPPPPLPAVQLQPLSAAAAKLSPVVQTVHAMPSLERHKFWVEPVLTRDIEVSITNRWEKILNSDLTIIVAQIRKFAAASGLGISLEGTVDVEGGMEVRPHHYIRSILPEGPVGQNGLLRSGDELLEVNGQRLLGMNHLEVVSILKELPQDVRMVCARGDVELIPFTEENVRKSLGIGFGGSQNMENLIPASDRLVKAKSDGSLATTGGGGPTDDSFSKLKSRSLEPLTGLAMWSSEPQIIELIKGERGLGFSILDYQVKIGKN